jgi:hypothetical protein
VVASNRPQGSLLARRMTGLATNCFLQARWHPNLSEYASSRDAVIDGSIATGGWTSLKPSFVLCATKFEQQSELCVDVPDMTALNSLERWLDFQIRR